jgi:Gram-negative bacterial TonB protein C-terminal
VWNVLFFKAWLLKGVIPFALTLMLGIGLGSLGSNLTYRRGRHFRCPHRGVAQAFVLEQTRGSNLGVLSEVRTATGQSESLNSSPTQLNERTRHAVVIFRPSPVFTDEAIDFHTSGTVLLRAVLSASGEVRDITPLVGLPHGLTEQAIEATRQMRFQPALRDGYPIDERVVLQYDFGRS